MRQRTPCTTCCEGWLQINADGEEIYPGKPCSNCKINERCRIYESRLEPCQTFLCGWREVNSPLPECFRPDKAKVIVLSNKFSWKEHPVDVVRGEAHPAARIAVRHTNGFCCTWNKKRALPSLIKINF